MSAAKSDIIRRCFAAYQSKDRKALADLFAEDFTFTSPYDDAIDKATYFERCWPASHRQVARRVPARAHIRAARHDGYRLGRPRGQT